MAAPLRTAWFNGSFMPLAEVRISPLDRAFLFGDAVYEVIPVCLLYTSDAADE